MSRLLAGLITFLAAVPLYAQAGNCTARSQGQSLVIMGDAMGNAVDVTETAPGSGIFVVTGLGGTTVNGLPADTISRVNRDVRFFGHGGFDQVFLHDAVVAGDFQTHNEGPMGDTVTEVVDCEIQGGVSIRNGNGFHEITIEDCEVGGGIAIFNRTGGSDTKIEACDIGGDVDVRNLDGFHETGVEECTVDGDVEISNRDGGSDVGIEVSFILGCVEVSNRNGFDEFKLEDCIVTDDVRIDNGHGGSETDVQSDDPSVFVCTIEGRLCIESGDGLDEFDLEDADVLDGVEVDFGDGGSSIDIERAIIDGDLEIRNGAGFDAFNIESTEVRGDVVLDNGDGGSDILFETENLIEDDLYILSDVGQDVIEMEMTTVGGDSVIATGDDDDSVTVSDCDFQGDFEFYAGSEVAADSFTNNGSTFGSGPTLVNVEIITP